MGKTYICFFMNIKLLLVDWCGISVKLEMKLIKENIHFRVIPLYEVIDYFPTSSISHYFLSLSCFIPESFIHIK